MVKVIIMKLKQLHILTHTHLENGSEGGLRYDYLSGRDQAQGTAFQKIIEVTGNDNEVLCLVIYIYLIQAVQLL
jgi:hypothetical protein